MATDKNKDVSCFTLDGVVAEMVIEVEDNQRPVSDCMDSSLSPLKDTDSGKEDIIESGNKISDAEAISEEAVSTEKKDDKENNVDTSETFHTEDKNESEKNIPSTTKDNERKVEDNLGDDETENVLDLNISSEAFHTKDKNESEENIQCVTENKKRKFEDNLGDEESEKVLDWNISSEAFHTKDKNECEKNIQSVTKNKKRKFQNKLGDEETGKDLDLPRYPGRKRQANKRYISDEMVTSASDSSNNAQTKEITKSDKRRKLDTDSKVVSKKKSDQNDSNKKSTVSESVTKGENAVRKEFTAKTDVIQNPDKTLETEKTPKKNILRKLPFRKNKDAPDVPDLKPKVIWWNGVGKGTGVKLGDLPWVRKSIKTSAKSIRALYRILFYQWPADGQDIVAAILNFNGFPFVKESFEFIKRHRMMKIMYDNTVSHICELLGVKKASKTTMINDILDFLLKPTWKIDPARDPLMQPVVLLERLELDQAYFQSTKENVILKRGYGKHKTNVVERKVKARKSSEQNSPVIPVRTTRNSMSKLKAAEVAVSKTSIEKEKSNSRHSSIKAKSSVKEKETPISRGVAKENLQGKNTKLLPKGSKSKTIEKDKSIDANLESDNEHDIPSNLKKGKQLKSKGKKSKFLNKNKVMTKQSADSSPKIEADVEMEVDEKSSLGDKQDNFHASADEYTKSEGEKDSSLTTGVSSGILSDSSETESAEETALVSAQTPSKGSPRIRRKGKPLKMFPEINESMKKAQFSALQRLHILLFGSSDKAENLKSNILAFGGFPFLEGSDEWKQKHFLLSLLGQSTLREYLKLLCIPFSDDDQPTMINKLMRFLAAPTKNAMETEGEAALSEVNIKESEVPKKMKLETKKKNVKKKEEKKGPRFRKVLMSEEEARRLEASFAREQRALARDNKVVVPGIQEIPINVRQTSTTDSPVATQRQVGKPKAPTTDPQQLNALLQTVYKRRALKAAGAVISTPNKGEQIRLGDIENVKFLIVTANFSDLEVLHNLIYLMDATKTRIRKNILDFDGFGFNEDSNKYKERMDLLNRLGYSVSKRLSFLLGLCPLHTDIPQQDLNELIMYFLMSPCKNKQVVPITQMPVDATVILPEERNMILKPSLEERTSLSPAKFGTVSETSSQSTVPEISILPSLPSSGVRQRAKKSFASGVKAPDVKKVLLPPAISSAVGKILSFNPKQSVGSIPKSVTVLNPVQAIPTFSIPKASPLNKGTGSPLLNNPGVALLNSPKLPIVNNNALIKVPLINNPVSKVQMMNSATKAVVLDSATKFPMASMSTLSVPISQSSFMIPSTPNQVKLLPKPSVMPAPVLPGSKMLVRTPTVMPSSSSSPQQEFLIQQKTPDGLQKTFKLIRLLPNHPLASAVKQPPVAQAMQVQQPVIITGTPMVRNTTTTLPPGIVIMKNNPVLQLPGQSMHNVLQTVPVKPSSSVMTTSFTNADEFVLPDEGESAGTAENDAEVEVLNPLEDNPPTDDELYSSIQEIILSSNFEDITLRNVIERVSAQFPHHDLTHRHNFMKDSVKKIIIGT